MIQTSGATSLESGSIEQVEELLIDAIRDGAHKHFDAALGRRKLDPDDVKAGPAGRGK